MVQEIELILAIFSFRGLKIKFNEKVTDRIAPVTAIFNYEYGEHTSFTLSLTFYFLKIMFKNALKL